MSYAANNTEWWNAILSMDAYDITNTTLWLYTLICSHRIEDIRFTISAIIAGRSDYESFLNKIMCKYGRSYANSDTHMVLIMSILQLRNDEKLIKMILYKNNMENTVAHIAAIYHLDRTLRFIKSHPSPKIVFEANIDGNKIKDLYEKNSMLNIL